MVDLHEEFQQEVKQSIQKIGNNHEFTNLSEAWMRKSIELRYCYNFSSLGRPIIQYPIDMIATQELIWKIRPDLIINTGIAHGGSAILNASCLALLDYCDAVKCGKMLNPKNSKRKVLAIDNDIRAHQKEAILSHPMSINIDMLQGSSIDRSVVEHVYDYAKGFNKVMVYLDSDHTHAHVLDELKAYAPLVSKGSYCLVWDGIIEHLPVNSHPNRPWGPGNNPKTAVYEYLKMLTSNKYRSVDGQLLNFEIDKSLQDKVALTAAPDGFLRRVEVK